MIMTPILIVFFSTYTNGAFMFCRSGTLKKILYSKVSENIQELPKLGRQQHDFRLYKKRFENVHKLSITGFA